MAVEFDSAKDEANIAKHGVSLALAAELEVLAVVEDDRRDYGEPRKRAFGLIDGDYYSLAYTLRGGNVRRSVSAAPMRKRSGAMSRNDANNPEWTEADFARAKGPESLSATELSAFRKTRGTQKAPIKVPIYIRLDQDVVEAFKAGGAGWQSRINLALKEGLRSPRTGQTIKVRSAERSSKKAKA